ncbi:MAG: methyltransferase domain-containing protein [Candidatus Eremiobacter antarcticus]
MPLISDFEAFYEERNAQKYITSDNPDNVLLVKRMARWLDLQPSDSILDFGCSDGYFLQRLTDRCRVARAVGIDLSDLAIRRARQLTVGSRQQFEFLRTAGDTIPFANETFDKIIVNEVIEHVPDAAGTLSEVARVAKPGALIYITAPNSLADVLPFFRAYCRKVDGVEGHLRRYSLEQFRRAANEAGMVVLRHTYHGFLACFLWYNFVIYNERLKTAAMRSITSSAPRFDDESTHRPRFNALCALPFGVMHLVNALDAPFRAFSGCLGIHVLLRKPR